MILIEPTIEYAQQISEYRREFLESGESMDGTDGLRNIGDPAYWIQHCEDCKDPEKVPEGLVTATQYIYVHDDTDPPLFQRLSGEIRWPHRLFRSAQ